MAANHFHIQCLLPLRSLINVIIEFSNGEQRQQKSFDKLPKNESGDLFGVCVVSKERLKNVESAWIIGVFEVPKMKQEERKKQL